jgi:F-type H+-transporting ATPase subunit delta
MSAIARRYARAAIEVALAKGGAPGGISGSAASTVPKDATDAIEALARGLDVLRRAYDASSELREVLRNPALRENRGPALQAVLQNLAVTPETARLVMLLAERERFDILDELVAEVNALADEHLGRARAYVTTAIALAPAQQQRLARALEKRFGLPVALTIEVDPTIIGGLVCRVGDVTMDSSIRHQLESVRARLLA